MKILSLCEHLTKGDRGGGKPNHWDTYCIVGGVKGEPFKGETTITVAGTKRTLDKTRPDLALDWAAERLGPAIDSRLAGKLALVPIPGHQCTNVGHVAQHRVANLAQRIADWLNAYSFGTDAKVIPLLFWKRVANSAHRQKGTRDPERIIENYKTPPMLKIVKRTCILIDDVVTKGGHICAAERFLKRQGFDVADVAFAVARSVWDKGTAVKVRTIEYDPWESDSTTF